MYLLILFGKTKGRKRKNLLAVLPPFNSNGEIMAVLASFSIISIFIVVLCNGGMCRTPVSVGGGEEILCRNHPFSRSEIFIYPTLKDCRK